MSIDSIHKYISEVEKIIDFGGTKKETAIRNAFYNLLNDYAKQRGLMMVAEVSIKTRNGKIITPDGTLKDALRQDWGYWESKDEADNLDDEIKKKFAKGYPRENILFEDSRVAVLFQNGEEVLRTPVNNTDSLHRLLTAFVTFERPEISNFRQAIELFKKDIPKVTETIREIIAEAEKSNEAFNSKSNNFLNICRESINPAISTEDIREMMIQHILTEDIFNTIFDETQFHRENNIARELESVISTFFTGKIRKTALSSIKHYYDVINAAAAGIADHHEKQKFLKVVYETFYKSYNPKAADRLGVVYTPNEIVRFMIESTDYLLHKHFNKYLEDPNVEILDPATGTGTFICDLIDYIRKEKLEYKYQNEIHANEVAILPYYISNLNVEFTFTQKMGKYTEFENLCFVDTLDNLGFSYANKQNVLEFVTEENSQRIRAQNEKKIAVIIGNPPYNANQANENDDNKNREYPQIDKRIKDTFIKYSTAQKTKVYDMYARFLRWAMDRIDDKGIIAFVSNNSFINSKTFDGFRKVLSQEFNRAYIINLKGNARTSGERRQQEGGNIFHNQIRVGVAIYFLVKDKSNDEKFEVFYDEVNDYMTDEEKLVYISENKIKEIPFEIIRPDKNNNWINLADNDFENLLPLCSKDVKLHRSKEAVFELYSTGISTNRDEWIVDFSEDNLTRKMKYFLKYYNSLLGTDNVDFTQGIKWSRNLKQRFRRQLKETFDKSRIKRFNYRPYMPVFMYHSDIFIDEHGLTDQFFCDENAAFCISKNGASKLFQILAVNTFPDLHFIGDVQCLPLYRYDKYGNRIDNITDWGLGQFVKQYGKKGITKEKIFYYVYAVLHNPAYRKKYELNLKREFPRIPFYNDFQKWSAWGKQLADLHINYETIKPYPLQIKNNDLPIDGIPKTKLTCDKTVGIILLDEITELHGIPAETWKYKLGNRSAIEWIIDQYKERKPKDTIIAEKFNTYRFVDYKEHVINLLKRICTVSVETLKIINAME
ncbi:MAG: N-6 DNA methylase [Planctomycetaceae bacterium]|jgi:predicted helicase|nr:N-6 DNA methylase [Planctomycetaceae bacterium]